MKLSRIIYNLVGTFLLFMLSLLHLKAGCTTGDASDCICPDGSDVCELLPDIVIAEAALLKPDFNPEIKGELRITLSIPNLGHGPLRILPAGLFLCGEDTIEADELEECPDGSEPKEIMYQVVYLKKGDKMKNDFLFAGAMSYHPTHEHYHLDDWCYYELRTKGEGEDPFQWPVVSATSKLGYCLRDDGSCSFFEGHCVNENGEILLDTDLPNFELGGGTYDCQKQGISVGYTDVYYYWLDDMDIPIPDSLCNGEYYLTLQLDPLNRIKEENEDNNQLVVPVILTQQNLKPQSILNIKGSKQLCRGESLELNVQSEDYEFEWSDGSSNQSLFIEQSGIYWLDVFTQCGTVQSEKIEVYIPELTIDEDTVCLPGGPALLKAEGDGIMRWYEEMNSELVLYEGSYFSTFPLNKTTTFFVEQETILESEVIYNAPYDTAIAGNELSLKYKGHLIFDAYTDFRLETVKVFSEKDRKRTIEWRDKNGVVLKDTTLNIPIGENIIELNFDIVPGTDYQLGCKNDSVYLLRNDSSKEDFFPFDIPDVVSIKASNYDQGGNYYYYYFYNWGIRLSDRFCIAEREPVTAYVLDCTAIDDERTRKADFHINTEILNDELNIYSSFFSHHKPDKILMFNFQGQQCFSNNEINPCMANTYCINIINIPQGIYILQLDFQELSVYQKIILY